MTAFEKLLPGVPSVESPFFEHIFSDPSVDDETRRVARELNQNGFAVIDFPDEEFDSVAEAIKSTLHDKFRWDEWRNIGFSAGEGMRILDAWATNEHVKHLAVNQKIISLLTRLFGRQAWPFQTLNFPVGTQQHYHTDSIHFSSMPERFMCGVWTALEDIGEDAGPLVYYPGSHKWPIYTNEHLGLCSAESPTKLNQQTYEPLWEALVELHGVKPQTFQAKKGQSLIWLSNLLHGGHKQTNPEKTRWSQVTHYYFEGCAYYTPMYSDPFYGSINFFHLKNLVTGERTTNQYSGFEIPEDFITQSRERHPKGTMAVLPPDFDPELYLLANKDVFDAGADPFYHYRHFGWKENRRLRP